MSTSFSSLKTVSRYNVPLDENLCALPSKVDETGVNRSVYEAAYLVSAYTNQRGQVNAITMTKTACGEVLCDYKNIDCTITLEKILAMSEDEFQQKIVEYRKKCIENQMRTIPTKVLLMLWIEGMFKKTSLIVQ